MSKMRSFAPLRARPPLPLLLILVLGFGLRLLTTWYVPREGWISDEGEYISAADWLVHGRGFAWYTQYLWTRAPLYPLFVAAHMRLFGAGAVAAVGVSQIVLSLANVALVFILARAVAPPQNGRVPAIAALLMALYLPFALYTQVVLSETVFTTLLLGGFAALVRYEAGVGGWGLGVGGSTSQEARESSIKHQASSGLFFLLPSSFFLCLAGLLFGLATLTRSLTLPFLPLLALWLLLRGWQHVGRRGRALLMPPLAFLLAAGLVIGPWTIYNSRVYGGPVLIDTSGAFNLLLGARTAHDGQRRDSQVRDFVLGLFPNGRPSAPPANDACAPYPVSPLLHQAARQSAMTREGLCLIADAPLRFVGKSLAELVDLFQINYTGAERFTNGFGLGRLPLLFSLATFLLDDTLYVLVLPLAVLGWALARRQVGGALTSLAGWWWAYNLAVTPLLFAINRFRLPLLPFAFIFAAYALVLLPQLGWRTIWARGVRPWSALAVVLFVIATTPYAYFEPRAPGADSRWASYFGPYPSSLENTVIAWQRRPAFRAAERLQAALHTGDTAMAEQILRSSTLLADTQQLGTALLHERRGEYAAGLAALESFDLNKNVNAALVYADILRRSGQTTPARVLFSKTFIDNASPVEWAWQWLAPPPTQTIDIAGNLDLGYIKGCYFGEGDTSTEPAANFRWCSDGAQLRFPAAGTGAAQTLYLRVDGRGWQGYAAVPPTVRVLMNGAEAGSFAPTFAVDEYTVPLPATPAGADVLITLRTDTFVPDAQRYLAQQGSGVGQVQRLGVRLDQAELR